MQPAHHLRLTEQIRTELAEPRRDPAFSIDVERYRSAAWLESERAALFGAPRIVGAAAAVREPGACLPVDVPGCLAIVVRGHDGALRAFANACRHRATRLVDAPCTVKAMTCPYHGWTYDLTGALIHVPHAAAFGGVDLATRGLHELAVAERHGLVWLGATDIAAYLGELDGDFAALGLEHHVAWKSAHVTRRCNWKLVVEAFLDGYHIRVLHRDSIYRFFLDAASAAEPVGPHIRAVTARRALREAPAEPTPAELRLLGTPSYLLFPATVVIEHPDFVSIIRLEPVAPDACEFHHHMLVPADRAEDTDHWTRSWALIDETVFQREDLWVCEQIQRGIAAGATEALLFGALESAVRWFHDAIDARRAT